MNLSSNEQSLVPHILKGNSHPLILNLFAVVFGALFIVLMAAIKIPLPWTPVPVTGQTFAVALIALLWGRKRGFATVGFYLLLGLTGLPVFALATTPFFFGPTSGYLIGMLIASAVVGDLADRGWTKTFYKSWFAALIGSVITFTFGLIVLSYFVPSDLLLTSGLIPFLPGDLLKTVGAAFISHKANSYLKKA